MNIARNTAPWLLALALLGGAETAQAAPSPSITPKQPELKPVPVSGVVGRVRGETAPLGSAAVYAYQLADLSLRKALTDPQGNFAFQDLPAGLYKIIAHKAGFVPVVAMLTRTTAHTYQFLELQLAPQAQGAKSGADDADFWAVRSRIPTDVLRDIDRGDRGDDSGELQLASLAELTGPERVDLSRFHTEMQAMTGVDQIASAGDGQVSSGGVGIEGKLGQFQVDLRGRFWQFNPSALTAGSAPTGGGQSSTLSLDLASGDDSRISLTSLNNRLVTQHGDAETPVAFEHYQVNWSQGIGRNSRSDFAAQYTEENNYHRQGAGAIEPLDIPVASRTWKVEGAYTTTFGEGNTLQTGLRYRERQFGLGVANSADHRADMPGQSDIDLFSRGGVRVRPSVLLEYGLYSTLADGSLAFTPKGGIVLQLNPAWQLEGSASRRAYQNAPLLPSFFPSLYQEGDLCDQGTEACYQVQLTRKSDDDDLFSLSALHRTIGETLRIYFSDDLVDRLESLYLVRGDQLPEVKMTVNRRLSPQIVTSLQSSVASGGGGTFLAADQKAYENQVHYMVTSLDTRFQRTSTGVFVALHHLSQQLAPLSPATHGSPQMETDRVQLMLTQDLNILFDLASQWAVQLNMEVSRGPLPDDSELRHRVLGGIAVKF
jgi:hypothetical protein